MQFNENSSSQEIRDEIARLDQLLKAIANREVANAREQIEEILRKTGKTYEEIFGNGAGTKKKAGSKATGKVAPKWIDASGTRTWSGRGRKPEWVDTEGKRINEQAGENAGDAQTAQQ